MSSPKPEPCDLGQTATITLDRVASDLIWIIFTDLGHRQQVMQTFDLHIVGSGCGQSPIWGHLWSSSCSPTVLFSIARVIRSGKKGLIQTGTDSLPE